MRAIYAHSQVFAGSWRSIIALTRSPVQKGNEPDPWRGHIEARQFDSTNYQVPVIGQGTWYIDAGDRALAIAALRRGIALGMNHLDTAEM